MKMALVALSISLLASCHPVPVMASETGAESLMVQDAYKVCGIAGVNDNDVCADVLSEEYVHALMLGARNHQRDGEMLTSEQAIEFSAKEIGCGTKTVLCREHVVNYASWYMYGQRHVDNNPVIQQEVKDYFTGDSDA